MEKIKQSEKISLVEKQKQEALENIIDILEERFPDKLKKTFESHGREYILTSAEDCMVAFAEQNREVVEILYEEIKQKDDYRSEQAIAKLFALFMAYEKLVVLYAELRSYYPKVAGRVEDKLPPLSYVAEHGSKQWEKIK
ncbi:MAG: hypothetical protein UZ19_OD1000645 [Parcubacteria bacterium OLB19]|nr:MAG: hypothetical protein UZ19_OD1000645 [Parcubacteria bacterium OLB19]